MKNQLTRIGALFLIGFLAFAQPVYSASDLDSGIREIGQKISERLTNKGMKKVAVAEFTQLDGSVTAFGQFFAEELVTSLFSVDPEHLEAVERRQLRQVLNEERISADDLLDEQSLRKLALALNIDSVVTGSIADLGDTIRINVRAVSVENARIFGAASTNIQKNGMIARLLNRNASADNRPARFSGSYRDDRFDGYRQGFRRDDRYYDRDRQGYSQDDRYYDSRENRYDRRGRGFPRDRYDEPYNEGHRGYSRYDDERYDRPNDRPRRDFANEGSPQPSDNSRTARVENPPVQPPQPETKPEKPKVEETPINPELAATLEKIEMISVTDILSRVDGHKQRTAR